MYRWNCSIQYNPHGTRVIELRGNASTRTWTRHVVLWYLRIYAVVVYTSVLDLKVKNQIIYVENNADLVNNFVHSEAYIFVGKAYMILRKFNAC